jgi:hypothetical protein
MSILNDMGRAAEKKIDILRDEATEGRREASRVLRESEQREKDMVKKEQQLLDKVCSLHVCFWLLCGHMQG